MGAYLSTPVCEKESFDADTKLVSYGASSMQGWRVSQEDAHNCLTDFDEETQTSLFAVYDGHGGAEVAQYTAQHLPAYIRDLPTYKEQRLAQALEEAFLGFDSILTQEKVISELRELAGVNPDDGETEEEQREEAQALCEEAEMPLQQLMERYGSTSPNSHIRFEDEDKNEAEALCAEASMPLQQLLKRYGGKGPVDNLRKKETNKFLSPALRSKMTSDNRNGHGDGDDDVKMRLEARLVNGHSENENNENLEREHRMQQQASSSSAEPCSSSSCAPATAGRIGELKEATGDVSSSSDASASLVAAKEEKQGQTSADSSTSPASSIDPKPKTATSGAKCETSADIKPEPSADSKQGAGSSVAGNAEASAKAELEPCSSKQETNTPPTSSKSDSSLSCSSSSQLEPCAGSTTQTAESTSAECSSTLAESSSAASSSCEPTSGSSSSKTGGSSHSASDAGSSVTDKSTSSPDTLDSSTSKQDAGGSGSSKPGPSTPGRGKAKKKWKSEEPPTEKGDDQEEDDEDDEDEDDEEDGEWWAKEEDSDEDEDDSDDDSEEDEEEQETTEIMCGGEEPGSDSGCTAVVALLRGHDLYVANAGDSRCVVSRASKALDMSVDHKPEDESEKARILKAGGRVTPDGRVNGGLNLSRAIGDHCYKKNEQMSDREQMITALPDVRCLSLEENDEFMILACDGIWNVMTSQEAVDFVSELLKAGNMKLSEICEQMFDFCLAPDTGGDGTGCDNMTCIIVKFNKGLLETGSLKRRASNGDSHAESDQKKKPKADSTDSKDGSTE